ncbi:MAG: cyclic nucleotide-binding domain-containing protein [Bdellovibrionales bacterium]|nr:cyclic nucleotide-binding domain-containing protein [Bdellovibrionales bacterium]
MDNIRRYKKGDLVFREGDPSKYIYVVQSGRLALCIDRGGKKFEIMQLGPSQIIGEQAMFSNGKQAYSVEALQESRLMEVPAEILKAQFEKAPPGIKLMVKSLVDETKSSRLALKQARLETEKSPCPQVSVPRIFSLLNLVARHTGKPNADKAGEIEVDWGVLKLYTARLFAESPQRMRSLLDLLYKLGRAQLVIEKNEEGQEELKKCVIHDIQFIEDFAEFYQYNLYKGGKAEIIYVDTLAFKVAKALVLMSLDLEPDFRGAVGIEYDHLLAELKSKFKLDLKSTHLDLLEKKGLLVKRVSKDQAVLLKFDKKEFERVSGFWSVIHEIDKWNEKGLVDLNESEEEGSAEATSQCPQCSGVIQEGHKFCSSCGFKLAA